MAGTASFLAERMATVELRDVTSRDTASHGVEVINAFVDADGLLAHDDGSVGINVDRTAEARLANALLENNGISGIISSNGAQGFTPATNGVLFTIGVELVVEDNGAEGILLQQSGHAQFPGGDLQFRGNGSDGIAADVGSTLALGIDAFQVRGSAVTETDGGACLLADRGAIVAVASIMPVTASGTAGPGLRVSDGAEATVAESTFTGNEGGGTEVGFGRSLTVTGGEHDGVTRERTAQVRRTIEASQKPMRLSWESVIAASVVSASIGTTVKRASSCTASRATAGPRGSGNVRVTVT